MRIIITPTDSRDTNLLKCIKSYSDKRVEDSADKDSFYVGVGKYADLNYFKPHHMDVVDDSIPIEPGHMVRVTKQHADLLEGDVFQYTDDLKDVDITKCEYVIATTRNGSVHKDFLEEWCHDHNVKVTHVSVL